MTHKTISLGKLCTIQKGATGIMKAIPGLYPMVTLAEQRASHNEYQFDAEAVIIPLVSSTGHGHASMKRVHYQEGKFALGSILCAVIPNDKTVLNTRFLHNYLSFFKESILVPLMRGAANVSLSIKSISSIIIPLPSLEEQLAINELVEKYSIKAKELQAEFLKQQSFLKQLRQSILQDAVQGKLTKKFRETERAKQFDNVEVPSSSPGWTATQQPKTGANLLARICAEKVELIRQGKLRKEKPLPPITDAEKPFELPEGWVWCRLGDIKMHSEAGRSFLCKERPCQHQEWGIIKMSAISSGIFREDENKFYSDVLVETNTSYKIQNDDFLITRASGSPELVGKSVVVINLAKNLLLNDKTIRYNFSQNIDSQFINFYNNSSIARFYYQKTLAGTSTSMKNITREQINSLPIQLPPSIEQKATVDQIEQLLGQMTLLENENKRQYDEVGRLMQAVLSEAFAGKKEFSVQLF